MIEKIKALSLHTHFRIRTAAMLAGIFITLISYPSSQRGSLNIGILAGLVLMFSSILWHILFVRCPHCGSHFQLRGGIPKFCPYCGKVIDKFH